MQSRISNVKVKLKSDRALESSSNACILIVAPWCPHFIYSIITQRYNCARKYWNIYFPCDSFLQCELLKWATLWNSQSEQSPTLLFMTLPNKVITDHFILGTNPRGLNGHVKPFLEIFCPYLSHITSIREQFAGPDNIPGRVLRDCAVELTDVFTDIFNISLSQAVVPTCFKLPPSFQSRRSHLHPASMTTVQ